MVRRDPPVLPVGLPGCGPPILARDRPICSMARGTAAFRREETCALGCTDRGWMPGGDLKSGVRGRGSRGYSARAGEPAAPRRAAGRSGGAIPAPGGGSSQPCREWTMGSHSPDPRRAARRCSSRERGDWPGPAGRACTGRMAYVGAAARQGVRRRGRGRSASAWTWPPPEAGSRGTAGGGEQPLHSGGERQHGPDGEPEPGQGDGDSPPDIPFC